VRKEKGKGSGAGYYGRREFELIVNFFSAVNSSILVASLRQRPAETLLSASLDNGLTLSEMEGAWNPHAGLVYLPLTRTLTSMRSASSSVRAIPSHL
jgi:hypothetical protein